jgi:CTP synthase (UTP-ammonia lyase)
MLTNSAPDPRGSRFRSGRVRIGLIGDHDPAVTAHQGIARSLPLAAEAAGVEVEAAWLHTAGLERTGGEALASFHGLWAVPATPYAGMDGALRAIRHAREHAVPFLGTCGGFQHALVEYARSVLGLADADHEESAPGAGSRIVTRLACSLVEVEGWVVLREGSRVRAICGTDRLREGYRCSFGLNPDFRAALEAGGVRITGEDAEGDARVMELDGHPFFLGTLFQPERAALRGPVHPLVVAFVEAAAARAAAVDGPGR